MRDFPNCQSKQLKRCSTGISARAECKSLRSNSTHNYVVGTSTDYTARLFGSRSRRIMLLIVILVVSLAAGVYSYWISLPLSRPVGPSVSIISSPIEFSIALDKTEYMSSENLTVYFSLKNISNQTVTVRQQHWYELDLSSPYSYMKLTTNAEGVSISPWHRFNFYFRVADGNGTEILDTSRALLYQDGYDMIFAPYGCWNQTLYISLAGFLGTDAVPAQARTFQITGILYHILINSTKLPDDIVDIRTPSIGFAVR